MTEIKLDKIEPIRIGKILLYPVNSNISEIFENGDSTGQLVIQDNRIVILGPKLVTKTPNHKDHRDMEV